MGAAENERMNLYAIIVAAGTGKRMGTDIPKQFLEIAGKPVLMHTIERFISFDKSVKIIIVLPDNHLSYWEELKVKYSFDIPHTVVKGGSSRFLSVKNGLVYADKPGLVAIHDGVRPFVSIGTIKRCFEGAKKHGNAIPVISAADSLRIITDKGSIAVDRHNIRQVQTPQVFDIELIKKAFLQEYNPSFTDDATVLEKTGEEINMVEGNVENIKITNSGDLIISEALFRSIL